jgi:hypothetical protein
VKGEGPEGSGDSRRLGDAVEREVRRMARAERERHTVLAQTVLLGTLGLVFVLPVVCGAYLVLEKRRAEELRRHIEEEAGGRAALFGARLLGRLATSDLEARIVEVVLEDLRGLSDEKREPLRAACHENGARITITSAYPLRADQRSMLTGALSELADGTVPCEFAEDRTLLAGVRVGIGPWVLRANLRDELTFFAETSHGQPE